MSFRAIVCVLASVFSASAQRETVLAITNARVFDGTAKSPIDATVIVRGNRIAEVGPGIQPPPGATVIDAAGKTLMPGIFDLHTHLPYSAVSGFSGDWGKSLKAYLYCGVTSVVDFGIYPEQFEPMRRLIREGVIPSPRIHMAARMSTPGGHGLEGGRGDFHTAEILTPRQARTAVKKWLEYKPDAIKVFTDGWRYGAAPDMTSMEEDALRVIVEEAHAQGVEVLTHTVTLAKAKIAARAGVDVIAHGVGDQIADTELLGLMVSGKTSYAPTLAVYEPRRLPSIPQLLATVLEPGARAGLEKRIAAANAPPSETNMDTPRLRRWKVLMSNTAEMRAGGVNFGTGTDAGVTGTWHGWSTLRELELLVMGGLTPVEAMAAATGNAARALHLDSERGFIAPGKLADLVLINGSPDQNINDIERVERVWIDGTEQNRETLAKAFLTDDPTPLPAIKAQALIDDFESTNGRTNLGTMRVNSTDGGHDNSRMMFTRVVRSANNHALSTIARMGDKARPAASVVLPLSRGGVEPVDASAFTGIEFEARGEGAYKVSVQRAQVRDYRSPEAEFKATGTWTKVRVPFSSLKPRGTGGPSWTGRDLQELNFDIVRAPNETAWLELDNVRFYQ